LGISLHDMKEINKKILIEALSTLPEYEPPVTLWDSLESLMGAEEWMQGVDLSDLPEHNPPDAIWANIERGLAKGGRTVRMLTLHWKAVASVAASVALLLSAALWLNRPKESADEGILSYSTEAVDPLLMNNDWDEDEPAFQDFLAICETKKTICSQPAFQQLQTDLEELTDAKQAIKAAMGGYGATPDLVLQIKDIELERNDIVKKMMVMLI
jgi:hypothetical protein